MRLRQLVPILMIALTLPGLAHADPARSSNPDALPPPPHVTGPPPNATRTATGLAYLRLNRGPGSTRVTTHDRVRVHYTGWTTDGNMFDSSRTRGRSAVFPVTAVIPGFSEALQLMVVGDRMRVWIPESLAYRGRPGAPAGMLVFDIEMLGIETPTP